ncbi:MAG: bacilysin biosynthesis protein BacA [Myxococcaceae bacterium]|nr:bacilysin biosynthesis protein BacA [Myxococcaceae bacterium]
MSNSKYAEVRTIHTLGPTGTNLEAASRSWREVNRLVDAEIRLHSTLEAAVDEMAMDGSAVLIACVVYPELHTLVFKNLERLEIAECFVQPTYNMVVASREDRPAKTIATHSAPQHLAPPEATRVFVDSNSQAAIACATGEVDACVTTLPAAQRHGLHVVRDFGAVPMGFSVHMPRAAATSHPAMA